ncbi:unnamed protein product, partial [Mesorhabditis belari]|uniref:Peroxisomal membrane protein PEX14 n=1 Tax=Mesorhabditis belari TaxID=2138241 RepID=A0AAF3FH34_9BILA
MDGSSSSIRPEMVEAAIKFMKTPKVYGSPWDEQRAFLVGKGLTEQEIEEARRQVPPPSQIVVGQGNGHYAYSGPPPPPPPNRIVSFAQSAVMISAVSYAGYRFLRSYVLPRFFDIPDPAMEETRQLQQQLNDLQNSMKFVIDSVSQTTQTLAMQQEEISKALLSISSRDTEFSRVEQGISTIRGLLLSHNQFAPIHVPAAAVTNDVGSSVSSLPSWQRAPPTNFAKQNGVKEKNAEENEKEEEENSKTGLINEEETEDFQDVSD